MGRRTRTERDAMTVEIGYALVSGFVVAAATFGGVSLPALFLDPPPTAERLLLMAGAVLGAVVFVVRVVHVLWRFPGSAAALPSGAGQPSQPGRTSPDS
ncbi:DUF6332 family protein [Streptomyces halstedii]|uniref:DUF6332 family protein n=1 Tax=Streptomyces TaxID=1883 RepID=UPI000490036D|nr:MULTISPECIES: DUF6332 family protein [unclassified Streptomyces]MYY14073.1 hypothetical protein [Streptomyces sp. SID4912]